MNNNLTNEQISRVFAMYQGQKVICFPSDDNLSSKFLPPTILEWNVIAGTFYGVRNTKLALTPLSAISDEDAVEVARLCYIRGEIISATFEYREQNAAYYFCIDLNSEPYEEIWVHQLTPASYQYLIQKSYAVPLFIEVGHPDNGKTAIDLGIAISRTELHKAKVCDATDDASSNAV